MEDRDVVAAIVGGDPAGLAEAYDRYAVPLYAYCCSVLGEPADAADTVQDVFLIAAARLHALRDPDKLRPWLYAVARNECLRRLRATRATSGLDAVRNLPASSADPGQQTEQADLRALVRDAIDGLNPGERDVIQLSLGHDLDGDDLAHALGVSRNHAHALLSRARGQLERSLGALIVARAGRAACAALDAMLAGWDGRLTVLMRKRIGRHIEHCEICGERKRRELTPALFASLAPLAAVLPGFRDQLLRIMADRTPAGLGHRMAVSNRASPFGPSGFPRALRPPAGAPWHHALRRPASRSHPVMTGAATSVVAAGVIAVVVMGGPHHGAPGAVAPGTTHGAAVLPGDPSPAHDGPTASRGSGVPPAAARSAGATASGAPGTSATPVAGSPAAGTPGSSSSSSSSSPSSSSAGTSPAATSSSPSAPASPGTLTVSSSTVRLVSVNGTKSGTFTITASGGAVSDFSIAAGSALAGQVTVSPATGSLASGASVTITVTTTSLVALDGQLTVNPGGRTVTIVVSVGL
jgi:RNA polymerase sigma factor (sigma-70 family)